MRIKGDGRILGDSGFVKEVLEKSQQQLESRYHYHSMGYDFDWLVNRVATLLGIEKSIVTRAGSYPGTVEARSILCYWAARGFGISMLELSKRLGVSQPTASQSVKRGEEIVKEKKHSIVEWSISIDEYPSRKQPRKQPANNPQTTPRAGTSINLPPVGPFWQTISSSDLQCKMSSDHRIAPRPVTQVYALKNGELGLIHS